MGCVSYMKAYVLCKIQFVVKKYAKPPKSHGRLFDFKMEHSALILQLFLA